VVVYVYICLSSFFLMFSLTFYPVDGMTVFSGLLVSIVLWKCGSDVVDADLFFFL
jgi:hypothetical protein